MSNELNELQKILKRIQFVTGHSIEAIAKEIEYTRPYLNSEVNKGISAEVKNKLLDYEAKTRQDVRFAQGYRDLMEISKSAGGESVPGNQDLTMQTLLKLANANEMLAESNKTLAGNNAELITLVKATANAHPQIPIEIEARFSDLLELIAEVASGETKFRSKSAGLASLSKRFHGTEASGS